MSALTTSALSFQPVHSPSSSPTLSHTPVDPSQSLVRWTAQDGNPIRQMGQLRPREATGPCPRPHCALSAHPTDFAQLQLPPRPNTWGDSAGTRNRSQKEGGNQYLVGKLPLQHFQLLLGPEIGAPFLEHAGAQLVHLPEELPLGQLQLLDSAARKQEGTHPGCRTHGRRFSQTPGANFCFCHLANLIV